VERAKIRCKPSRRKVFIRKSLISTLQITVLPITYYKKESSWECCPCAPTRRDAHLVRFVARAQRSPGVTINSNPPSAVHCSTATCLTAIVRGTLRWLQQFRKCKSGDLAGHSEKTKRSRTHDYVHIFRRFCAQHTPLK
jgi:hypothetical protein